MISIFEAFRYITASFRLFTLEIGILNSVPDDVLTTSEFIGALLLCDIIIPVAFAATAVLIIAPKFLTSVIPSNKIKVGLPFFYKELSINSSIFINLIGDKKANAPW